MTVEPKVLLVAAANARTGGGEKHVYDLMRHLPRLGFEVALACPPGGDLGDLASELGVCVFDASLASGVSVRAVAALRQSIEDFGPDVVHAHGSRAAFYARRADPEAERRVVYTVHGIHADKAASAIRRTALSATEKWLMPRTVAFVTVCESDAANGARLGFLNPERTVVIHNGIELPVRKVERGAFRREIGLADRDRLVLHVGRYDRPKDQATLLRAWANVATAVPHSYLAIIGSGALEEDLKQLASSYAIADRVRFCQPRPDLAPAYTDADVFVLTSRWEGLPYVLLEAMAYGLPVVATNVDGIPEAVDDSCGVLVEPGDFRGVAGAIHRLLDHAEVRVVMGESGRERVAHDFTLDQMVRKLAGVYRGVVGLHDLDEIDSSESHRGETQ